MRSSLAVLMMVGACATSSPELTRPGEAPPPAEAPAPVPVAPPAASTELRTGAWATLPATPALPAGGRTGTVSVDGAKLFYIRYGHGSPVILLHGGLANSAYWGNQIPALAADHDVVAIDFRGQGRSTAPSGALGYKRFAADVVAVMDQLRIPRAAIVGWSDGGIVGLQLAISHPDRVERVFAFGANASPSGTIPGGARSDVFARYTARAASEYRELSPNPQQYGAVLQRLDRMWASEPNFTPAELRSIRVPVAIVDGDHDEVIRPQHTRDLARAIPGATLIVEPGVSHFAMLQNPVQFNTDMLRFLGGR